MTLKELARRANVSVSTASKALHYSKELHNDTIELVNRIARESGYFSQLRKQRLNTTKNKPLRFVIICPEIVSVHYTQIATLINDILFERNAVAEIHVCNFDYALEREIMLSCLRTAEIDGIITLSAGNNLEGIDLPLVGVTQKCGQDSVVFDLAGGCRQALAYLKENGHSKIGFIGENLTKGKNADFISAMEDVGLKADERFIVCSPYRFEKAGFDTINDFIDNGKELPTAFLTAYDEIAMGAVSALLRRGVAVPDDISVIGINNVPSSEYFPVPITTIGFDIDKLCQSIVGVVFDRMDNPSSESVKICLETELIVRGSSGAVKLKKSPKEC